MEALLKELIPHAPNIGLFVAPNIPRSRLQRALSDYAPDLEATEVVVLYDATRFGTGGDGAVFASDRFAFQNNNFESAQHVAYRDVVGAVSRKRLLGGRYVELQINRGRATVNLRMDFSARPGAAPFVERFLSEAIVAEPPASAARDRQSLTAIEEALQQLVVDGHLSPSEMRRMLGTLTQG